LESFSERGRKGSEIEGRALAEPAGERIFLLEKEISACYGERVGTDLLQKGDIYQKGGLYFNGKSECGSSFEDSFRQGENFEGRNWVEVDL